MPFNKYNILSNNLFKGHVMTNLEYFYQYSLPFAKQSGICTYKGVYAFSLNEESFKDLLGVCTNQELCDNIFTLEQSGKMYISASVHSDKTMYDVFITRIE